MSPGETVGYVCLFIFFVVLYTALIGLNSYYSGKASVHIQWKECRQLAPVEVCVKHIGLEK